MRKLKKILIILFLIVILYFLMTNYCYAAPKYMVPKGLGTVLNNMPAFIWTILQGIFAFITIAVTGYLVIKLTWTGIKYFIAVSAQKQAEIKGELTSIFIKTIIWFVSMTLLVGLLDIIEY